MVNLTWLNIDALSVVVAIIDFSNAVKNVTEVFLYTFRSDSYGSKRFGRYGAGIMTLLFMHPKTLGEFEWDLNSWNDSDIVAWKDSYLSSCNVVSVASAIIGQVALTSLSLPDLNQTQWTARAFLIAAMVLGVLSVVAASYQQMTIGMQNKAVEIRLWLSDYFDQEVEVPVDQPGKLRYYVLDGKFPLRSSLSAQQLIRLPFALLGWAVYSYLAGFGLYLGFGWVNHVDTNLGRSDNRNVLIVFLVAALLSILLFMMWSVMKASEQIGKDTNRDPRQRRIHRSDLFKEVQKKLEPIKWFRNQQQQVPTVLPRRNRFPQSEKVDDEQLKPGGHQQAPSNAVDWSAAKGNMQNNIFESHSPAPALDHHTHTPVTDLARALQEAANTHKRCAEANMAVAVEYERLLARSTTTTSNYGHV